LFTLDSSKIVEYKLWALNIRPDRIESCSNGISLVVCCYHQVYDVLKLKFKTFITSSVRRGFVHESTTSSETRGCAITEISRLASVQSSVMTPDNWSVVT